MRGRPIRELEAILLQMDGRGYKAYREIKGEWGFPDFLLSIDHVQGDPFAAPTRASAFLEPRIAQLPPSAHASEARALGTACLLARRFLQEARSRSSNRGTGKSGEIRIEALGEKIPSTPSTPS